MPLDMGGFPAAISPLADLSESKIYDTPNRAIPVVALLANGPDVDIDVAIAPKGLGALTAQVADGAIAGGNKRGAGAVDLQMLRTAATQVASGTYSAALGRSNIASGANAVAIGSTNTASGASSVALGGSSTASGSSSVAIGSTTTASGASCVALGQQSVAAKYGQFSEAAGRFAANGDAQRSVYVLRNSTADATATELFLDGASLKLTLATNQTLAFRATVVASTSLGADVASWEITGLIRNNNGTVALVGTPTVTQVGVSAGASTWVLAVTADNTNKALILTVTGVIATNIRWVATVYTSELTF